MARTVEEHERTLNSWGGIVVANGAIVPAGIDGAVSVFVTDPTDVILDVNGYFDAPAEQARIPSIRCSLAASPIRVPRQVPSARLP